MMSHLKPTACHTALGIRRAMQQRRRRKLPRCNVHLVRRTQLQKDVRWLRRPVRIRS